MKELQLMTIKDISQQFKIKESWIRHKIFIRDIPFIKMGALIRFNPIDIKNWLDKMKIYTPENI